MLFNVDDEYFIAWDELNYAKHVCSADYFHAPVIFSVPLTPKIILLHWNTSFSQFFLNEWGKIFLSSQNDWMLGKTLSLAWHTTGLIIENNYLQACNVVCNYAGPEDVTIKQHFCKILWRKLCHQGSFKDRGTLDLSRQSWLRAQIL